MNKNLRGSDSFCPTPSAKIARVKAKYMIEMTMEEVENIDPMLAAAAWVMVCETADTLGISCADLLDLLEARRASADAPPSLSSEPHSPRR